MESIIKKQDRSEVLENRREKVIAINSNIRNDYFGNDVKVIEKMLQAQRILKAIRSERESIAMMHLANYKKSFEHDFLMSSKGLNGSQILRSVSKSHLSMNDLKLLTQP